MKLSWSTPAEIAAVLSKTYPEEDRLALTRERLLTLVEKLPGFQKTAPPTPACLDHILWTWMRFAEDSA